MLLRCSDYDKHTTTNVLADRLVRNVLTHHLTLVELNSLKTILLCFNMHALWRMLFNTVRTCSKGYDESRREEEIEWTNRTSGSCVWMPFTGF